MIIILLLLTGKKEGLFSEICAITSGYEEFCVVSGDKQIYQRIVHIISKQYIYICIGVYIIIIIAKPSTINHLWPL